MITVKNVSHAYNNSDGNVLRNVTMEVPDSSFCLLLGQSGSGKTSLLNIVAGLMKPSKGEVFYSEKDIYKMNADQLCTFRHENIGFVFQNYFLENLFTAEENVRIPLLLECEMSKEERDKKVKNALCQVGLSDKIGRKPTELSGGECQRVSIARALVTDPKIIIADEPTGNLDSVNGERVMKILKDQVEMGRTVLMVTHNEGYLPYADCVFRIVDGEII